MTAPASGRRNLPENSRLCALARKSDAGAEGVEALGDGEAVVALGAFVEHGRGQACECRGISWAECLACGKAADEGDDVVDRHVDGDDLNAADGGALHMAGEIDEWCVGGTARVVLRRAIVS